MTTGDRELLRTCSEWMSLVVFPYPRSLYYRRSTWRFPPTAANAIACTPACSCSLIPRVPALLHACATLRGRGYCTTSQDDVDWRRGRGRTSHPQPFLRTCSHERTQRLTTPRALSSASLYSLSLSLSLLSLARPLPRPARTTALLLPSSPAHSPDDGPLAATSAACSSHHLQLQRRRRRRRRRR